MSLDNSLTFLCLSFLSCKLEMIIVLPHLLPTVAGRIIRMYMKDVSYNCKALSKYNLSPSLWFWTSIYTFSIVNGRDCLKSVIEPTHFFLFTISQSTVNKKWNIFQWIAKMKLTCPTSGILTVDDVNLLMKKYRSYPQLSNDNWLQRYFFSV